MRSSPSFPRVYSACFILGLFLLQAAIGRGQQPLNKPHPQPSIRFSNATNASKIRFIHEPSAEKKYLIESVSGGVLLLDYDQDGWLDIYFTNAPTVDQARQGKKARNALYHNNQDGTFTDVSDKAGVSYPCWAMGGAVADYNNDGWPDMLITCEEGVVLYRNNGSGTFTDVTKEARLTDNRWTTGAAFADYSPPNYLYRNDGNGHFTDVSFISGAAVSGDGAEMAGMGVDACDYNRSGRFSIHVTNFEDQYSSLFKNDGDLSFSDVAYAAG